MVQLGFKYETHIKIYYVDGPKYPETRKYRKKMIRNYLEMEKQQARRGE
jgi:hypothetical protein